MIKAIETKYRGYRFRSRLEARWAVFFDHIGLDWLYEHEGYVVDGRPYLPDFFIPSMGIVIEIKPKQDPGLDLSHLWRLAEKELPVCLFCGLPGECWGTLFCNDATDSSGGFCNEGWQSTFLCLTDRPYIFVNESRGDRTFLTPGWNDIPYVVRIDFEDSANREWLSKGPIFDHIRFRNAIDAAKSARFEHGENGGVQ